MPNVKIAVSLAAPLFEQAEALAQEMQISRSRLVALALEDFIQRRQNQQLLGRINAAYADVPDAEEVMLLQSWQQQHRRLVEGEW